jgi:hypothetical protein
MKANPLKEAFERQVEVFLLENIFAARALDTRAKSSRKFKRIARSVAELGLVEPLVVTRKCPEAGKVLLLDGHARLAALLASGAAEAKCIIAHDDEAFTYNKRVSHLATIQEHYMIMKAIAKGASEQRIADALDVDVKAIRARRNMLNGICPEVVERLKSRSVHTAVFASLRRMKPLRQMEATDLMIGAGNLSASYARVLLAGTRPGGLTNPERKRPTGVTAEQMDRMQHEMETVQADFKEIEDRYGDNVLQLVVATGYVGTLIRNIEIETYLSEHHPEILMQFKSIVSATSLV